jgi:hypothetical protein
MRYPDEAAYRQGEAAMKEKGWTTAELHSLPVARSLIGRIFLRQPRREIFDVHYVRPLYDSRL